MEAHKELKIIETKGNFDIIRVAEGEYAVRKRYKSFLGKQKQTFMVLDRNGVDLTFDSIVDGVTISGLDRAQYVFNANVLMAGGI